MKTPIDEILDACISRLKMGESISACLADYAQNRNLQTALEIAAIALRVPTKTSALDQGRIWKKIELAVYAPKKAEAKAEQLGFWNLRFSRPVFAGILLLVAIGLVNATAVAAKKSLPGETLYPVKKTVEKLQLTLTIGETKKTEVRIQQAETRLTEARTILSESEATSTPLNHNEEQAVATAVNDLVSTNSLIASEGEAQKDKALLEKIVKLTDKQHAVLSDIKEKVSGEAKEAVSAAIGSATVTEKVAKDSLAELENPREVTDETATSTVEGIIGSHATTTSTGNGLGGSATSTASTTPDLLETYGDPDASSTEDILLPSTSVNDTTTPIIINLR